MNSAEWAERIEQRIAALESLGEHISDPEDREIDRHIRRVLRAMITFAWLVRHLTVFAGAVIAAKLAWDTLLDWMRQP